MNSSWLFGDSGKNKACLLYEKFVKNRMALAEQVLDFKPAAFHPILGDPKNYQDIPISVLEYLTAKREVVDLSPAVQLARKNTYEQLPYLEYFDPKHEGLIIEVDILSKVPSAETEYLEAIKLIESACPWMFDLLKNIIVEICPISSKEWMRHDYGMTDYHLTGVIFSSLKERPFQIIYQAISIAHELGHNVLMIYQKGSDPIHDESKGTYVYSGVRKTERPVYSALHAAVALGYMIEISRCLLAKGQLSSSERSFVLEKLQDYEISLYKGLKALQSVRLDRLGKYIFRDLSQLVTFNNGS